MKSIWFWLLFNLGAFLLNVFIGILTGFCFIWFFAGINVTCVLFLVILIIHIGEDEDDPEDED